MKRRRRLLAVLCTVIAGIGLPLLTATPASAGVAGLPVGVSTSPDSWACIVVEHVNVGVCQGNPLPSQLPVDVPDLPV